MSLSRAFARQVPPAVRAKGAAYFENGAVVHVEADASRVDAIVRGTRPYRVWIARDGDALTASCECQYFKDREAICKHIWAVAIEIERSGFLGFGKDGGAALTLRPDAHIEAKSEPKGSWQKFISEVSEKIARAERDVRPPRFRDAEIIYAIDRTASLSGPSVALDLMSRTRTAQGKWGRPKPAASRRATCRIFPIRSTARSCRSCSAPATSTALGTSATQGAPRSGSPVRSSIACCRSWRSRAAPSCGSAASRATNRCPLAWDDGPPWVFRLEVGHVARDESISIDGALVRGSERLLIREPTTDPAERLPHSCRPTRSARYPRRLHLLAQLRGTGPLAIPPGATGQLVDVLARSGVDPSDLPEELQFEIVANPPRPIVQIRADERGGSRHTDATVAFDYEGMFVDPAIGSTSFDRDNRRLVRRDSRSKRKPSSA